MIQRRWKNPGRGSSKSEGGMKRIAIGFDPETFEQVYELACKGRVPFGEQVRQLVEFGLEAVEDDSGAR